MTGLVPRPARLAQLRNALSLNPIAALLGPRQVGKTTLARGFASDDRAVEVFDLEDPVDVQRLSTPRRILGGLEGLVVIDEVQRRPELLELLRVLVDRPDNQARFLLLGSASPDLVKGASESLAGRISFVDLGGFDICEVERGDAMRLWLRGGFPRSFLARDSAASLQWRDDFMRAFLERDIPQLGISIPAETLRRFWTMVAHFHGQIWNAAEFARSLGRSENTARSYLDILSGAFMVRVLPPWFENTKKRQVKSPKIYLRDTGILHALLQIESLAQLEGHPKVGASWEGFAMEQVLSVLHRGDPYFWATHGGAELDLMVRFEGRRLGFEFKYSDAPRVTRSMRIALEDLSLEHLWVLYPGERRYSLDDQITALPVEHVCETDFSTTTTERSGSRNP